MISEAPSRVTAIVVTHDSAGVLGGCLDALGKAGVPTIVVDNASSDGTVAVAGQHCAQVIRAPFNEGYGRANNRGIKAATGANWCLIVNPDLVIEPNTVTRLLNASENDPQAAMVVPVIVENDGRVFDHDRTLLSPVAPALPAARSSAETDASVTEVAFASGACMLVRRDAFQKTGGFDPKIFLFYEDDDLCLRLRRDGWRILKATHVRVSHVRGGSASPRPGRAYLSRYHQSWSRFYVARKHGIRAGVISFMFVQGLKALAAYATFNRPRMERHGGSVAGAWAALRRRPAFADGQTSQMGREQ